MADSNEGDPPPAAEENAEDQQSRKQSIAGQKSEAKADNEDEKDGDQSRSTNKRPSKSASNKDGEDEKEDATNKGDEEAEGVENSIMSYAFQISRATMIFFLGCFVTWEVTGVFLWRSLERRI